MVLYLVFGKRNMVLIAEAVSIEVVMEALSGIAMAVTTLPDPYGNKEVCGNPQYAVFGSWVAKRLSASFCGNLIWSGHTYHTYLSLFIIYRGLLQVNPSPCPNRCSIRTLRIIYWIFGVIWLAALISMLIFTRFHYTVDVFVSLCLTTFVVTNRNFIHVGVRFFYPPAKEFTNEELDELTPKAQFNLRNLCHKDTSKL